MIHNDNEVRLSEVAQGCQVLDGSPSLISKCCISDSLFGSLILRNKVSERVISFNDDITSRSLYRFRGVCRGLDRIAFEQDLSVYFITFTLAEGSVESMNSSLEGILHFLRRTFRKSGKRLYYAWVVELQKRRYYKSGTLALHWHFVVLAPQGALPDVKFNARSVRGHKYQVASEGSLVTSFELFKRWGRGQVLCGYAWSGIRRYLEKYLVKEYESFRGYKPEWANLNRFGSSHLGYMSYPEWAYGELRSLSDYGVPLDLLWVNKIGKVVSVCCEVARSDWSIARFQHLSLEELCAVSRNERSVLYRFESPWAMVHSKVLRRELSLSSKDRES